MVNPFDYGGGLSQFFNTLRRQKPAPLHDSSFNSVLTPRGAITPANVQPVVSGVTKETLADHLNPNADLAPSYGPQLKDSYGTLAEDIGLPDVRDIPAEEPPHIRFSTPTSPMGDYSPGNSGIESFAGGKFMGAEGTPGGGGYAPSQTDWSKVSNPMAFEAYSDPLRKAQLDAETKHAQAEAIDPLYDEREKAKIWTKSQLDLQEGIQAMLQRQYTSRLQEIQSSVEHDMPNASPEEKDKEMRKRLANLEAEYSSLYGTKGASGSTPNSYSGYPIR